MSGNKWIAKNVAVDQLKPFEKNPRKISADDFENLKRSLREDGYHQRILCTPDLRVIGGHQRIKALKELGWGNIEVLVSDREMPDEQFRRILVRDNMAYGQWDFDALSDLMSIGVLEDLGVGDDVLVKVGARSKDGLTDPDEVPAAPIVPVAAPGDVWRLGEHRVMCGDSTKAEDVAKLMDGAKCELLFTSPPYSDQRTYGGGMDLSPEYLSQFIDCADKICEYMVINLGLKRKDHEIVPYWDIYIAKAKAVGFHFLQWGVWARPSAGSVGNQSAFLPTTHEWMLVFGTKFKDINRCEERRSEVNLKRNTRSTRQASGEMKISPVGVQENLKELESVVFLNPELSAVRKLHPATFPVALPEKYINAITDAGQSVYEPFSGSGSTLIACEKTGRVCYGMELSPAYCDVIINRWEQFTGQKAVRA